MPWPNIVWPSFHKLSPLSPYSIVSWYVHSPFMGGKGWLCIRKWKTVSGGLVGLSDDILPNNAPAHIPALCLHRFANSVSAAATFTSRYCSLHMGRIMQPVQSFCKNEYFNKEILRVFPWISWRKKFIRYFEFVRVVAKFAADTSGVSLYRQLIFDCSFEFRSESKEVIAHDSSPVTLFPNSRNGNFSQIIISFVYLSCHAIMYCVYGLVALKRWARLNDTKALMTIFLRFHFSTIFSSMNMIFNNNI